MAHDSERYEHDGMLTGILAAGRRMIVDFLAEHPDGTRDAFQAWADRQGLDHSTSRAVSVTMLTWGQQLRRAHNDARYESGTETETWWANQAGRQ